MPNIALTPDERAGGMMEPGKAPDVARLVSALRSFQQAMGGAVTERMRDRGQRQQAHRDAGNRGPMPLAEGDVDLADSVAGSIMGSIKAVGGAKKLAEGLRKLDMSQDARMARARDQGFHTNDAMFHASHFDFREFDLKMAGRGADAGAPMPRAVWLTNNATVADTYLGGAWVNPNSPQIIEKVGNLPHEPGRAARYYAEGANVQKVLVRMYGKKDFDVWDMSGGGFDQGFVSKALREAKKDGRAGVVFRGMRDPGIMNTGRPQMSAIIAAFDPKDVRSIHAAFDPKKKGSRDLLASIVGAGAVTTGAMSATGSDDG